MTDEANPEGFLAKACGITAHHAPHTWREFENPGSLQWIVHYCNGEIEGTPWQVMAPYRGWMVLHDVTGNMWYAFFTDPWSGVSAHSEEALHKSIDTEEREGRR
jgi:hypothetical protein